MGSPKGVQTAAAVAVAFGVAALCKAAAPVNNPVADLKIGWADELKWANVVSIADMQGANWDEKFKAAQDKVATPGGVVFLPAGTYEFKDHIRLRNGVIIRGEDPSAVKDARDEKYALSTKVVFPKYQPSFEGQGTAKDSAFKGIRMEDPVGGRNCGAVNLDIDHGHVELGFSVGVNALGREFPANYMAGKCGENLLVFGCILKNAAILDEEVPLFCQNPWQRWTQRHHGAIEAGAARNVLIANNRIPKSGDDNFVMKGAKLVEGKAVPKPADDPAKIKMTTVDLLFDYDNRPGISVNYVAICADLSIMDRYREITAETAKGQTPTNWPNAAGFAPGIVVRQNYVYCSGCTAIRTSGNGTRIADNVIRYEPKVVRPTANGKNTSTFTNNNRAIELRGWRWEVTGNDYEIYSNLGPSGNRFGDGEGIMHEAFNNVDLRDSKLINNRGNAYLCIWRVPVYGLLIQGNRITQSSEGMHGVPSVCVLSCKKGNKDHMPCKNVQILENTTEATGIEMVGVETEGNVIRGNKHVGPNGKIDNRGNATVEGNENYVEGRIFE
jgi:hypothetical protein